MHFKSYISQSRELRNFCHTIAPIYQGYFLAFYIMLNSQLSNFCPNFGQLCKAWKSPSAKVGKLNNADGWEIVLTRIQGLGATYINQRYKFSLSHIQTSLLQAKVRLFFIKHLVQVISKNHITLSGEYKMLYKCFKNSRRRRKIRIFFSTKTNYCSKWSCFIDSNMLYSGAVR